MIVYEYVGERGRREMTDWPRLDVRDRRGLNLQLDILRQVDRRQALRGVVFKVKGARLYKIKARGNKQLRPRLCFGPLESEVEVVTFLQRAEKKDRTPNPPREVSAGKSQKKMREIIADPRRYRAEIPKEKRHGRN